MLTQYKTQFFPNNKSIESIIKNNEPFQIVKLESEKVMTMNLSNINNVQMDL